ncbi:MAG: YggS family pyridoxal phosphate-dependent enzyme [Candidatus Kapabacteria bacterium]|nr:YggS family pyridoxal phosphate-dependent enzyme [Candidatus Kapabacteria bacterium]
MSTLEDRLRNIHERMNVAAVNVGRNAQDIRLLLATKNQSAETLRSIYGLGELLFGENRVQEFVSKSADLQDLTIDWQFIGHLQTNKVRDVIGRVSCIQSADRDSLIDAINTECLKRNVSVDVMVEVNTSGETSKYGVAASNVEPLIDRILTMPTLRIVGFMTIGALSDDERVVRQCFEKLRYIRDSYDASHQTKTALSMGMSDDLEWAIAEGSTIVRVGTAIFGER